MNRASDSRWIIRSINFALIATIDLSFAGNSLQKKDIPRKLALLVRHYSNPPGPLSKDGLAGQKPASFEHGYEVREQKPFCRSRTAFRTESAQLSPQFGLI